MPKSSAFFQYYCENIVVLMFNFTYPLYIQMLGAGNSFLSGGLQSPDGAASDDDDLDDDFGNAAAAAPPGALMHGFGRGQNPFPRATISVRTVGADGADGRDAIQGFV